MVKIIANQSLPYGKKRYAEGDEIEASEKDARLLVSIRKARLPPVNPAPAPAIQTMTAPVVATAAIEAQDPVPEPETETEAAPEAPAHPQTYARRDMVAEPTTGRTGPERQSPSSHPAPPRKGKR